MQPSTVTEDVEKEEPLDGDEWCTPLWVIDRARDLMGSIDMDPATCFEANERVKATYYFTKETDGLKHHWDVPAGPSTVLCNPPYSKKGRESQVAPFLRHMAEEYRMGSVREGILVTNVATDADWFRLMWHYPLCFPYKRMRFYQPKQKKDAPRYANVIAYFGKRPARFAQIFSPYGHINPAPAERNLVRVTAWVDPALFEQLELFTEDVTV